jgi:hypothetical protein
MNIAMIAHDEKKLERHLQFLASKNQSDISEKKRLGLIEYLSPEAGSTILKKLDRFSIQTQQSTTPKPENQNGSPSPKSEVSPL